MLVTPAAASLWPVKVLSVLKTSMQFNLVIPTLRFWSGAASEESRFHRAKFPFAEPDHIRGSLDGCTKALWAKQTDKERENVLEEGKRKFRRSISMRSCLVWIRISNWNKTYRLLTKVPWASLSLPLDTFFVLDESLITSTEPSPRPAATQSPLGWIRKE